MSLSLAQAPSLEDRVATQSWPEVETSLDRDGWAVLKGLVEPDRCRALAALYDGGHFRSRVVMARHGFGQGEYQYFDYPLPGAVEGLRRALYMRLAPVADRWRGLLGQAGGGFPSDLASYTAQCHAAGQTRPTPLLLKYGPGDYNRLHQDVYGETLFPFQVVILLSRPDKDFSGGELVLVEQKPRSQSRATVMPLEQGDAAIFAVNHRPARSQAGYYRAALRHGVSTLRSGQRFTLGIIFHDAA